jgi:hypothetical protein
MLQLNDQSGEQKEDFGNQGLGEAATKKALKTSNLRRVSFPGSPPKGSLAIFWRIE